MENTTISKECLACGKIIFKRKTCSQNYWSTVLKFCSKKCINLGRKHSEKSREKMSISQKGRKHTTETIEKMSESRKRFYRKGGHSSFYGKPHTDEIKHKIALSRMGEKNWAKRPDVRRKISAGRYGLIIGEDNLRWHGKRNKGQYSKRALLRDNFTCQRCGLRDEVIMDVDHILPRRKFPELAYKLDNLMTLCPNCHRRKTLEDHKLYPQKWTNQHTKTKA